MFTDASDAPVSQLTNVGRTLLKRTSLEGLSFIYHGWAMGRGGYVLANPVKVEVIDPADTTLIDQIYPSPITYIPFVDSNFEFPNFRGIVLTMRLGRGTTGGEFGLGEVGVWVEIINSPVTPVEVGDLHLFAIGHFPLCTKTELSANVRRLIIQM